MQGDLPARVLGLVIEWAEIHQQELKTNGESLATTGKIHEIAPLT